MPLIDRVAQDDARGHGSAISAHQFSAALFFYGTGDVTRQQIINGFGLEAEDLPQLDNVLAHIDGLTGNQKLAFHGKIESANVLLQTDGITKTKYKQLLGIS